MNDEKRFEFMGIHDGKIFEISELCVYYMLDLKEKKIFEVTEIGTIKEEVRGLYDSMLRGDWHVRFRFKG